MREIREGVCSAHRASIVEARNNPSAVASQFDVLPLFLRTQSRSVLRVVSDFIGARLCPKDQSQHVGCRTSVPSTRNSFASAACAASQAPFLDLAGPLGFLRSVSDP